MKLPEAPPLQITRERSFPAPELAFKQLIEQRLSQLGSLDILQYAEIFQKGQPDADVLRECFLDPSLDPTADFYSPEEVDIVPSQGGMLQVWDGSALLAQGTFSDIAQYVSKTAPHNLGLLLDSRVISSDPVIQLRESRAFRRVSRAMDKFSKISQLDFVDQDSIVNIFFHCCLSGDVHLVGYSSELAVGLVGVRIVDEMVEDCAVLIQCVQGGDTGAEKNRPSMVQKALEAAKEHLVFAEVYMDPLLDVPGRMVYKPRPHNLVAVVEIDLDYPPLYKSFEDYWGSIVEANVIRDASYVEPRFGRRKALRYPDSFDYIFSDYSYGSYPLCTTPRFLHDPGPGKRRQEMAVACRNRDFRPVSSPPSGPFVRLRLSESYVGRCLDNDIRIGSPEFSLRSLLDWGFRKKKKLVFNHEWYIMDNDKA